MDLIAEGGAAVRIRRNSNLRKNYASLITDDNIHLVVMSYDGSLNLSGLNMFFDDMSTPVTPTTSSGGPMTSGAYLQRISYWQFQSEIEANGKCVEVLQANVELNAVERQLCKDFFLQNPAYASLP